MEPAGPTRVERRLAAILAADVAGYSRLIEADEEGTLSRLRALRAELDPKIAAHRGRMVRQPATGCSSSSPVSSTLSDVRPKCRRLWPKATPRCRRTVASSSALASTSATLSSRLQAANDAVLL
jgi:hypothetical protein